MRVLFGGDLIELFVGLERWPGAANGNKGDGSGMAAFGAVPTQIETEYAAVPLRSDLGPAVTPFEGEAMNGAKALD